MGRRPCNLVALNQQEKIVLILLRKSVIMYQRSTATMSHTRLRKWYATVVMRVMTMLKIAMHLLEQAINVKGNHILPHLLASKTVVNVIRQPKKATGAVKKSIA